MTVLLIVFLSGTVILGSVFLIMHEVARRAPFPSPVVPGMRCPFCGHEMRHGRIAHAGYPLWWEPNDAPRPRLWVSTPGTGVKGPIRGAKAVFERTRLAFDVRGASVCGACEAVVLDPKARPNVRSIG